MASRNPSTIWEGDIPGRGGGGLLSGFSFGAAATDSLVSTTGPADGTWTQAVRHAAATTATGPARQAVRRLVMRPPRQRRPARAGAGCDAVGVRHDEAG